MRGNRPDNPNVWMRLRRRRKGSSSARSGGRAHPGRLPVASALLAVCVLGPGPASAAQDREVSLSVAGGYRVYDEPLGLKDDAALLFRVDLGLSSRAGLAIDYLYSDPVRSANGSYAHVDHARLLGRVNALTGRTRPYGLFGVGVFVADFSDTYDTTAGTVSAGVGIEQRFGPQFLLRAEATAEFYEGSVVLFGPGGRAYSQGPRTTEANGTFSAGLGFHF